MPQRRFPPPWSVEEKCEVEEDWSGSSYRNQWSPGRGSRFGFFNFQSSRTLPRIAASAMTINPTTHRLRTTVKNRKRNAILKI
jgi:hypothetical protein